jgi:hypothetical protein
MTRDLAHQKHYRTVLSYLINKTVLRSRHTHVCVDSALGVGRKRWQEEEEGGGGDQLTANCSGGAPLIFIRRREVNNLVRRREINKRGASSTATGKPRKVRGPRARIVVNGLIFHHKPVLESGSRFLLAQYVT